MLWWTGRHDGYWLQSSTGGVPATQITYRGQMATLRRFDTLPGATLADILKRRATEELLVPRDVAGVDGFFAPNAKDVADAEGWVHAPLIPAGGSGAELSAYAAGSADDSPRGRWLRYLVVAGDQGARIAFKPHDAQYVAVRFSFTP